MNSPKVDSQITVIPTTQRRIAKVRRGVATAQPKAIATQAKGRTCSYSIDIINEGSIPREVRATISKTELIKVAMEKSIFVMVVGLLSFLASLMIAIKLVGDFIFLKNTPSPLGALVMLVSLTISACTAITINSTKEALSPDDKGLADEETWFYHPSGLPTSTEKTANQWRINSRSYRQYVNNLMVLKKIYLKNTWEEEALQYLIRIQSLALRAQDPEIIDRALPLSQDIVQAIWANIQFCHESKNIQPECTPDYQQYQDAYALSGESWTKRLQAIEKRANQAKQAQEAYLTRSALHEATERLKLDNPEIQFDQQLGDQADSTHLVLVSSIESNHILSS